MSASKLDLAFCMDCTGSMGSYIRSACDNIETIVREIVAAEKADVRFSLVRYRDFCDKDRTYLVQSEPFTSSLKAMKEYLEKTNADGGGDAPEAVATGLFASLELPYRDDAVKVLVWIADAPPHGLGDDGDSLPDGDPLPTPDILETVGSLKEKGVIVYSVGVEPAVGSYPLLRGFMRGVADRTGGRYVPLGNAPLLAQVIIGGAREEINLEKVAEQVQQEVEQVEKELGGSVAEEEVYRVATERLKSKGVRTGQMQVEDVVGHDEVSAKVSKVFFASPSLRMARASSAIKEVEEASAPARRYEEEMPVSRSRGMRMMKVRSAPAAPPPSGGAMSRIASALAAPFSRRSEREESAAVDELSADLSEASLAPPPPAPASAARGPTTSFAAQSAAYMESEISLEQVMRVSSRKKASS